VYIYIKEFKKETMKNILAENLLRFGVRNLSESDIKKIEEIALTEEISKTDLSTDIKLKTALVKRVNAGIQLNVPFVVGEYIFIPEVIDTAKPSRIRGFVQKFITNTNDKIGKVILYPDVNNKMDSWFTLENYNDINNIKNVFFQCVYETGVERISNGATVNKITNDAINIHKNLSTVTAAYNANPNKSSYDALINTMRNEVNQTVITGTNTTAKNFATALTGNAKAFYNLIPQTAAPTSQPAPPQTTAPTSQPTPQKQ
jgi:hypothetical protein